MKRSGFTIPMNFSAARIASTANPEALPQGAALDLGKVTADTATGAMPVAQVLAATHTDAALVLHDGKVVAEHYVNQQATAAILFSRSASRSPAP